MSLIPHAPDADSPFLPDTYLQFAWDSVSLGNAFACFRRYQYAIIGGWTPNTGQDAVALIFGLAFHSAMEEFHNLRAGGTDYDEAVRATIFYLRDSDPHFPMLPDDNGIAEIMEETPEDDDGITIRNSKLRTRYHLLRAVIWYLEHYRNDPLETIILPSGKAAVELSFRIPLFDEFILSGHIDRAAREKTSKRPVVVDYKTTKSISSQFFQSFTLSHQISGYTMAGQIVLDEPATGAVIDGIALLVGGVKYARAASDRTPSQLTEYLDDVHDLLRNARYHAERLADNPHYEYPKNTQSCYFCQFKEVCRQPVEYRRRYLAMSFSQKNPWNPLENR